MTHTIYVDRDYGAQKAVLTLQRSGLHGKSEVLFHRLPVETGQYPYLDSKDEDWVQNKGGTPYGTHWMSTKKRPLTSASPYGTPFYPIATEKGGSRIIGPNGHYRENIGLHLNNDIPGTAGCTALQNDTPDTDCITQALFAYLDRLNRYETYIRFVVL